MEKKIKEILACREKACIDRPGLIRAAVLIPLFKKNGEYYVLLTRRTDKVSHHKGQISFPGGRQDQGEDPGGSAAAPGGRDAPGSALRGPGRRRPRPDRGPVAGVRRGWG